MENGEFFITAVFQVAQRLMAEGVELTQPFSSEVCHSDVGVCMCDVLCVPMATGAVGMGQGM
jgi:hypothetical protein